MITLFGIRHHGPGCARSLLASLEKLAPDMILLEMPQEAEPLLIHAADPAMKPPVALLLHRTDAPETASFYPFARFSPEWQAVVWAARHSVPVRCMDLPAAHRFALRDQDDDAGETPSPPEEGNEEEVERDPFSWLARADGYTDGERWWNDRMEERRDQGDFFQAILEAVTTLRDELALPESRETLLREAWMRRCLKAAEKDGYQNIAVVCGAWHVPALNSPVKASQDQALLKGLPKHKVAATWIPWTSARLAFASGYSAGIRSPGWYDHLWNHQEDPIPSWLTRAARILRAEGQEASSASVIEAVRLADSLAGMRGRPLPGLDETLESIQAIFCHGDPLPLRFLDRKLLIGEALGDLPDGLPTLPLQQDIEATLRRLRLKPAASVTPLELDLREDGGKARSAFLHRLLAAKIHWGKKEQARTRGTFKERWMLQWKPELSLAIIDASAFGNTLETAAARRLLQSGDPGIASITRRLDLALTGDLPAAVAALLRALDAAAATAEDIGDLLEALPPLAAISRYGDVRTTDAGAVTSLIKAIAARIHVGLPAAGSGLSEDAASLLSASVRAYSAAVSLLEDAALTADFHRVLRSLATMETIHPKLRGLSVRLLRDASHLDDQETARHLSYALSPGTGSLAAAAWLEGFLQGSGSLLVHDQALLSLIDAWIAALTPEEFLAILPLLRRTFSSFTPPEKSRIAARAKHPAGSAPLQPTLQLDAVRAAPAITATALLLGLIPSP